MVTATGFTIFPCDRGVSTGLNRGWHDFVVIEGVAVCRLCGRRATRPTTTDNTAGGDR